MRERVGWGGVERVSIKKERFFVGGFGSGCFDVFVFFCFGWWMV